MENNANQTDGHSRTKSTYDKRIIGYKNRIHRLERSVALKNFSLRLFNTFVDKLLREGRITKDEMYAAVKSKKLTAKIVDEHIKTYQ